MDFTTDAFTSDFRARRIRRTPEHCARLAAKRLRAVRRRVLAGVETAGPPGPPARVPGRLRASSAHAVYELPHDAYGKDRGR
ncbi:hypothetical protein GCM10010353_11950 [Streptomyces chryseus]|uniref:Uncharacterized protein n=1 Tax=Streptomyces chryseus TaxID=68186 RepID=A0ABQ3DJ50_9ACTN|nr:hypothetical protein GCM10010353_11950 [Streptomyces chryseus]GHA92517.1 hypothetical protein GCM10010346_13920 [Streptomyces chryseus]